MGEKRKRDFLSDLCGERDVFWGNPNLFGKIVWIKIKKRREFKRKEEKFLRKIWSKYLIFTSTDGIMIYV